ncbi:MAG: KEOPS complex subunit Pcc1 [Candidatus Bathyarchaeia archaeon]
MSYETQEEAEAVAKAVSPDNAKTPLGLVVETSTEGRTVITRIDCQRSLKTLLATLDDLLSSIQVAEKTLRVAARRV